MGGKGFGSRGYVRTETDRSQFYCFSNKRLCGPGSPFLPLDSGNAGSVLKIMIGIARPSPALDSTLRSI